MTTGRIFRVRALSLVIIAVVFIGLRPIQAQSVPLHYLGIENGLSNNSVRCIYQDHDGFMWFGTYDGLNRFDGYEFKVYRNKLNDTHSLAHNYIYAINEDKNHHIWVGTGQGISVYNRRSSTFNPAYYINYASKARVPITSNINAIKTDTAGNVLIGSNGGGLLIQSPGSGVAVQLPFFRNGFPAESYNVHGITIDKKGRAWLLVQDVGLCRYDYTGKKIVVVNNVIRNLRCLEADVDDNLWIGTNSGIHKYSITSNTITESYGEQPNQLTSLNLTTLKLDKQQQLWIGTEGGGVNIFNTVTKTFSYLLPGEDKNMLSSESAFTIFEDKESRKWIGTLKGGIDIIDPHTNQFQTISHSPFRKNSLVYNFVSSFNEDQAQQLWIGTDGGGLSIWDRGKNTFVNFRHTAGNSTSLSHNSVTSIKQDRQHNTWISTFGGGINKFNPATNSFTRYRCVNDSTGAENKNVWLLYLDREEQLWASTFGNGKLYRFNRASNRFEVFDQELNDLISLEEDSRGELWGGNSYQLSRIDKKNRQHAHYNIGKPIRAIFEDSRKNLWLGTEGGGLVLFNRENGKIGARFSVDDGLSNNSVLNIVEDKQGNLWLSTFNGLSKFNPVTKTFRNFYQSDGLQSNQFLYNSALRLRSGNLVFGGINGFNIFNPDSLRTRNHFSPVLLTGLRINNQPVASDHEYVTGFNENQVASLQIPYNTAIAFDFATIEYTSPGKIKYAYYLEGWDRGWTYTNNNRSANYSHIREGNYTLRIKSTNAEGTWNEKETTVKLGILPPWFRTWWAYFLYTGAVGAFVFFYIRYKASQAKLKYKVKLAQLNAEKEKEINEKKLTFFTNVSHEFRTPLTLIINPAKELLNKKAEDEGADVRQNAGTIYRNARRLLSLVDQLLLFRKADSEADKLLLSPVNFELVCREVYECFVQQANARDIQYEFESEPGDYRVYADKEKIEIVLFNVVSNALKYTPDKGLVHMRLFSDAEGVRVSIADNGPGIPAEIGNKLYERFYRDETVNRFSKTGFGIGLFLTKHFIDIHKGTIRYESELGKGTTFYVTLQKGKTHYDEHAQFSAAREESLMLKELVEEPAENLPKTRLEALVMDRQSLLVIDDDRQMREYLVLLFGEKYQVYEAESGEAGLVIAEQNTPDIIISDIKMAQMSGMDLCQVIKTSPELRHIPVVLLTGSSSKDSLLKSTEVGADDYITKPFEKEFLVARIENILKSRSDLHQYFFKEITLQKNDLKVSAEDKEFINACIRIVEDHLLDDQFTIQKLATEIGMSHSNLYLKVKAISGQTVNSFVRFIRLRRAAALLISTDCNVNEVIVQVGINDKKYFREQFNKLFGMNPSAYIKKFRKPFNKNHTLSDQVIKH
jgi:signal transduction histidine kinase/ligand-binding sensor domain-containing protein/DNA-binding NarL/FixJ family response regulator